MKKYICTLTLLTVLQTIFSIVSALETTPVGLNFQNNSSIPVDDKQIQTIIDQADKLYWQGNYKTAIDLYKQISEYYADKDKSSYSHWLASIADCYCHLNKYEEAEDIYEDLAQCQKRNGQLGQLAQSWSNIAACNFYLRKYDKAEEYCQKALASLEKEKSIDNLLLAKTHLGFGEILYQESKYKSAIPQYVTSINLYDKMYNLSRQDIIEPLMVALEGAGASNYYERNYEAAKPFYERLADIQNTVFGNEDVRYGWTLVTISDIEQKLGNTQISDALYEKSVYIFRKANRDRLIAELQNQGKLTPELAEKIDHYSFGNSDRLKAKQADSILKKTNTDAILECLSSERSLAKPGPWNLVTSKELDPPGWVWLDASKPLNGIIICVHGLGLNARSYTAFAKSITPAGYMVIAFDVRGFGSYLGSKGGDKVNFHQCLNDLSTVLKIINKDNQNIPIYLLGESMGGAIALQVTASHPELMRGLICSVPAGSRYKASSTDLDVAIHLVKGMNKPFNIGTKVINQATQEETLRKEWSSDPFNRLNLTPKELLQFAAFMNQNKAAAEKIKDTPVIVFQGVQDKLVKPKGTMEIYNTITNKDKDLILIGTSEHLIFETKTCPKSAITGLVGWIEAHEQKPADSSIK